MKKKILENVKTFRNQAGLSQEAVAEKLHVTQSKYARFERGATKTDLDLLIDFCNLVGITLVELITYPDVPAKSEVKEALTPDDRVLLSIELKKDKREQVLRLIFGDNNLQILNT